MIWKLDITSKRLCLSETRIYFERYQEDGYILETYSSRTRFCATALQCYCEVFNKSMLKISYSKLANEKHVRTGDHSKFSVSDRRKFLINKQGPPRIFLKISFPVHLSI